MGYREQSFSDLIGGTILMCEYQAITCIVALPETWADLIG